MNADLLIDGRQQDPGLCSAVFLFLHAGQPALAVDIDAFQRVLAAGIIVVLKGLGGNQIDFFICCKEGHFLASLIVFVDG